VPRTVLGYVLDRAQRVERICGFPCAHCLETDVQRPFSTIRSTRSDMERISLSEAPLSGPSMIRMASPWTADHARYSAPGLRSRGRTPASTSKSSAELSSSNGFSPLFPVFATSTSSSTGSGVENAVWKSPLSARANFRYPVPTARRVARAFSDGELFRRRTLTISASIASASDASDAALTACNRSRWLEKCLYAAFGATPARRVASRKITACGPPARANSMPACKRALRRSP